MARNVEIKARVSNVEAVHQKAAAVADKGPVEITQDDTFFRCESGRLKLRAIIADGSWLPSQVPPAAVRPDVARRPMLSGGLESGYGIGLTCARAPSAIA